MLLEESFADGRLLCRLVGLLDRNNLSGIEWRSPSVAASRHNVTKVSLPFVCTFPIDAKQLQYMAMDPQYLLTAGYVRVEEETKYVLTESLASCRRSEG